MDAYTTGFLSIVALSIVAVVVPTVKLKLKLPKMVDLQVDKQGSSTDTQGSDTE